MCANHTFRKPRCVFGTICIRISIHFQTHQSGFFPPHELCCTPFWVWYERWNRFLDRLPLMHFIDSTTSSHHFLFCRSVRVALRTNIISLVGLILTGGEPENNFAFILAHEIVRRLANCDFVCSSDYAQSLRVSWNTWTCFDYTVSQWLMRILALCLLFSCSLLAMADTIEENWAERQREIQRERERARTWEAKRCGKKTNNTMRMDGIISRTSELMRASDYVFVLYHCW